MKKGIFLLFLLASVVAVGQRKSKKNKKKDTIGPTVVTVITSYTPTIADAFKIKKNPKIALSDKTKKQKLSYSILLQRLALLLQPIFCLTLPISHSACAQWPHQQFSLF